VHREVIRAVIRARMATITDYGRIKVETLPDLLRGEIIGITWVLEILELPVEEADTRTWIERMMPAEGKS